jgi:hypothetical protein
VLLSEGLNGESRCTVSAARALDTAGYAVAVTVSGGASMAAASRACSRRVPVPFADREPDAYAAAIAAESARDDYAVVVPTSDAALLALDAPVRHLLDKAECSRRARDAGIPVAPGRVFASAAALLDAGGELEYPLVVKPAIKRFAAVRVDTEAGLREFVASDGELIAQPFIEAPMSAVAGVAWRGELVSAAHMAYERIWPLPCGTVASARTVAPDPEMEDALLRVLDGYDGPFHAEFLGPYLQDLNPRVHGTLPLAVASGANLVATYCDLVRGLDVEPHRGAPGLFFRWIEGDVRSIVRSMRDGTMPVRRAARALTPHTRAVHSYESMRDPGPMVARLRYLGRRLRDGRGTAPAVPAIAGGTR